MFAFVPRKYLIATKDLVMSSDSDATTPTATASRSSQWAVNTTFESRKLSYKESDWNLPGSTLRSTRTRHGGVGRPNLTRKSNLSDDSSDEDDSEDGEFEPSSSDTDESETEADNHEPETSKKPPATRVILEVESLTKMMHELSKCHECGGPIDVEIKTTCIASHVKAACLDPTCGFILHSEPLAPTTIHENSNDNYNRNTDYAVNVLYMLGMLCNGDGCTEAAKLLGLLG